MVKIAQGTKDQMNDGVRQIALRFPEAMFKDIASRASEKGISFAEYVRVLVVAQLKETT